MERFKIESAKSFNAKTGSNQAGSSKTETTFFCRVAGEDLARKLILAFQAKFKDNQTVDGNPAGDVSVSARVVFEAVACDQFNEGERLVIEDQIDRLASDVSLYCAQWQIEVLECQGDGIPEYDPNNPPLYNSKEPLSPECLHHQATMWQQKLAPPPEVSLDDILGMADKLEAIGRKASAPHGPNKVASAKTHPEPQNHQDALAELLGDANLCLTILGDMRRDYSTMEAASRRMEGGREDWHFADRRDEADYREAKGRIEAALHHLPERLSRVLKWGRQHGLEVAEDVGLLEKAKVSCSVKAGFCGDYELDVRSVMNAVLIEQAKKQVASPGRTKMDAASEQNGTPPSVTLSEAEREQQDRVKFWIELQWYANSPNRPRDYRRRFSDLSGLPYEKKKGRRGIDTLERWARTPTGKASIEKYGQTADVLNALAEFKRTAEASDASDTSDNTA